MTNKIGFASGCIRASKKSMEEMLQIYKDAGATAIEMHFMTLKEAQKYSRDPKFLNIINQFEYKSYHIEKDKLNTQKEIKALKKVIEKLQVHNSIVHPDKIEDFKLLEESKIPFLYENMDKRKKSFQHPAEFKPLKDNPKNNFVFDIQHAFEIKPTLENIEEFMKIMNPNIKEFHISGENKNQNHSPLIFAENIKDIQKIISHIDNQPIILEGEFMKEPYAENVKKEIEYMKKLLKKYKKQE